MKKRILAGALLALFTAVMASACDDGGDGYYYAGDGRGDDYGCHRHTSCGTCTPVDGCGWCQTGVGQGICASDPDQCANATAFSWTWDPSGCVGSAAPTDAGTATAADSATISAEDAAPSSADATPLH